MGLERLLDEYIKRYGPDSMDDIFSFILTEINKLLTTWLVKISILILIILGVMIMATYGKEIAPSVVDSDLCLKVRISFILFLGFFLIYAVRTRCRIKTIYTIIMSYYQDLLHSLDSISDPVKRSNKAKFITMTMLKNMSKDINVSRRSIFEIISEHNKEEFKTILS